MICKTLLRVRTVLTILIAFKSPCSGTPKRLPSKDIKKLLMTQRINPSLVSFMRWKIDDEI